MFYRTLLSYFILLVMTSCSSLNDKTLSNSLLLISKSNKSESHELLRKIERSFINSGHFKSFDEIVDKGYTLYVHPERENENIVVLVRQRDTRQGGCGGNYLIDTNVLKAKLESGESNKALIKNKKLLIPNSNCNLKH